jgi:hypothetical protein
LNERDQRRAHRFETEGHRDDPLDPRGPTRTLDHNTDPDIAELARRERNGNGPPRAAMGSLPRRQTTAGLAASQPEDQKKI